MRKYNPIEHSRTIWYDDLRKKNHPRNCKAHHRFCSLDYQWRQQHTSKSDINKPINQTIFNVILPNPKDKTQIRFQNITEQAIDDWFAQSINRTIPSMLNPNKKFFIPQSLDEEIKLRYNKQKRKMSKQKNETYFKTRQTKSQQKSYLSNKKRGNVNINELCFDYKNLQIKQNIGNTLIKARQNKNTSHIRKIHRRNAILLQKDIHYQRFSKQLTLQLSVPSNRIQSPSQITQTLNKNKLFTYNYQSLRRRHPSYIPNSIIQYQGFNIHMEDQKFSLEKSSKEEMIRQEEQQEIYRMKGNAQAERAYSIMENFSERTKRTKRKPLPEQMHIDTEIAKQIIEYTRPSKVNSSHKNIQEKKSQGLGKKVLKLLDSMHVQSETINIQMTKFKLHIDFLQLKNIDPNNISHKWIRKAQKQTIKNDYILALDCYKQSIIAQPQSFNSIYNFAALLQRENRYSSSLEWLRLAGQFQADDERVNFAISLVQFKKQNFDQSFNQVNKLILTLLSVKRSVDVKYYYLRALCYKKLEKHEKAKQDYKFILKNSKPANLNSLSDFIFSKLYADKRKYKTNIDCLSYVMLRQTITLILFDQAKRNKDDRQTIEQLCENIIKRRFFKRFSPSLIKKLLQTANYQYIQAKEIVFVRPQQTIIIVDGLLLIQNHQQNILCPSTLMILQQGDFVGACSLDKNVNKNLNNWYTCHTQIQLLRLPTLSFQSLWKGQVTFQIDYKYNYLKNISLFRGLPDSTLFKLCQLMSKVTYRKGEILFNDCSYRFRRVNKYGTGFGLAKVQAYDKRFHSAYDRRQINQTKKTYRLRQILNKTIFKFNILKFNRITFPGLFVVIKGKIEIQDDRGFRNSDIIGQRDFFGENLVIQADGFHNYGRIKVDSQQAQLYQLGLDQIIWCFSSNDKLTMTNNCINSNRKSLQIVKDLRKRFYQKIQILNQFKIQT